MQLRTAQPGRARPGNRKTLAILGAFCLFLSTIECVIPKPMPFMRLGIANLPLMLALDILPFGEFLLLALIKVAGQGLVTGTLFSYILLFSLAGTFVSALAMYTLRRILGPALVGMAGISVLGALLSNAAQLLLARLFVFGPSVRYLAPPFLAMGLITGAALGLFCQRFMGRSRWYERETSPHMTEDRPPEQTAQPGAAAEDRPPEKTEQPGATSRDRPPEQTAQPGAATKGRPPGGQERADKAEQKSDAFRRKRRDFYERIFGSRDLCVAGLLMTGALVFNPNPYTRLLQFLFFVFLVWFAGKKNNPLITIAVILGIVAFNLLAPYGRVLFSAGVFTITEGALKAGLQRAATLEGLIMLSRFAIRRDLRLPGSFGRLIGESFRILAAIQERRNAISGKNIVAGIDALMLEFSREEAPPDNASPEEPGHRSTVAGRVILAAAVILAWVPCLLKV